MDDSTAAQAIVLVVGGLVAAVATVGCKLPAEGATPGRAVARAAPMVPLRCYWDHVRGYTAVVCGIEGGTRFLTLVTNQDPQQVSADLGIPLVGWDSHPEWECGWIYGDADHSGVVDFDDINAVYANWGAYCEGVSFGVTQQ